MQTLDHIQVAKIFVISFPRPINAWVLTSYLVKDVGAQEAGLVRSRKPALHTFQPHVQLPGRGRGRPGGRGGVLTANPTP